MLALPMFPNLKIITVTCNCNMGIPREQPFGRKQTYFKIRSPTREILAADVQLDHIIPIVRFWKIWGFPFVIPTPVIEW